MRILGLFLGSILIGAAAIGAWIYLGGSSQPPLLEEAELPRDRSKVRYAPYVVLVPAPPEKKAAPSKPAKQSSQRAPLTTKTNLAKAPEPSPLPPKVVEPAKPTPARSEVARQALVAILGDKKESSEDKPKSFQEPVRTVVPEPPPRPSLIADATPAEQPVAPVIARPPESTPINPPPPPERKARPEPAPPATVATPAPPPPPAEAATPAPAPQQVARKEPATKLKYEVETNRQAQERDKKQTLLGQGTVRFRRVIPVAPGQIKAGENIVQLAGVVALDADAQCNYATGGTWDCGKTGTYALRRFIRSRSVVCDVIDEISPTQVTGRCTVGGTDISKWIVRRGWGVPTSETRSEYSSEFNTAQKTKVGQWRESESGS